MSTNVNKSIQSIRYQKTIPNGKAGKAFTFPFLVTQVPLPGPIDWANPGQLVSSNDFWHFLDGIYGLQAIVNNGIVTFKTIKVSEPLTGDLYWHLECNS